MKAKVFDGIGNMSHGKVVRIKFELDFYINNSDDLTI